MRDSCISFDSVGKMVLFLDIDRRATTMISLLVGILIGCFVIQCFYLKSVFLHVLEWYLLLIAYQFYITVFFLNSSIFFVCIYWIVPIIQFYEITFYKLYAYLCKWQDHLILLNKLKDIHKRLEAARVEVEAAKTLRGL